ncbi:molybdopterin oxidoreductase family protein [Paenibacillus validus]|uniref:Molybdopterin-dependent oxidoreductase n=1 Tax=Paenibacillus validus TaxID=44253 RepID=A0A7X2ZDA1_9BACL|nr:molybdopterin oxidoreductase family protein [Paenibacillus validus]MED4602052.1 molybdopterin oxidoreductase family protein [Paenibacillus validus]MED4607584.1 molybdopterin oxidoreductase family protein [Paenibacillus validus]MUG72215.1 molybdopterin-dependent oxidoreductase [Paenibacillus validus]
MNSYVDQETGVFPSVCSLDCPDQCGLLIHKEAGKIVKIEGDPAHPVTQGAICNKVRHMAERIYDPNRLRYPLKRTGKKGERRFERISWEEAIDTITTRWKRLIAAEGAEAILPYSFYGNMGMLGTEGMDRRFFHRLGASRLLYTICQAAGTEGYGYTMGGSFGIDPEDTVHSKLIIMWGINAVSTNMHQVMLAEKARKNGATVVVIDVHKNQTGRWADWFIPVLPGTDAALALGIMHILFAEQLVDEDFLREYTVGHEELRQHVRQYEPAVVSSITGVPKEDLYRLARLYGQTSPSFIRIGNGPQHHDNGGMCIRTISCLPALTGQWLKKGGGAIKGNSGYLAHHASALQRPDLLRKPTRRINMNELGSALLELEPPIRSLYVYNSNPAVVAPHANKVRQGLQREDLFTVVHDLFLTETAAYADIVLPATSSLENTDFYRSYWHHYVQLQRPVIKPYAESKSNVDVFRLLAQAMGFEEPAFQDTEAEMIRQALDHPGNPHLADVTYETLAEKQFVKGRVKPLLPGKLPTPSGKIELYSRTMERRGFPPLPTYTPLAGDGDLPFLFIPAPNHNFLNSTFAHNEKHVRLEKAPKLHMNEADAAALGITTGDCVRLWNDRGECELMAIAGEDVLPGVVVTQGLWADSPGSKTLVNALTPDRLADMGGGAVFFSGRVNVEKVQYGK